MSATFLPIDPFLRGEGLFAPVEPLESVARERVRAQLRMIVMCGMAYGLVMGSFGGVLGVGWQRMAVSAIKTPFLFTVTFLLCVPSFYVMNALAGLHGDFPRVLNALLGFQSTAAIVLAALAPVTWLMNVSTADYSFIVMWNGIMFAVASLMG